MVRLPTSLEWRFVGLDPVRVKLLESPIIYRELINRIAFEATVSTPKERLCDDDRKDAPGFGSKRWEWQITLPPSFLDRFYNSRYGLRAHYWSSSKAGTIATRQFLDALKEKAEIACPDKHRNAAMRSYLASSSKVWPLEKIENDDARALVVDRWAKCESLCKSPPQWRWMPSHEILQIKGAFLHSDGREHVPISKQDRETRIHLTGWSGQKPFD